MIELLKTKQIYNSSELQHFVFDLESRYNIESAEDRYHNLVNFSTNTAVPYHKWFIYREGFASELINELIRMSGVKPGECIIDPFCGSGTTNVVAALKGFDTLGLDVNPMSAYITNTKITHYSLQDIEAADRLSKEAISFRNALITPEYLDVKKYFDEDSFFSLLRIKTFIDSIEECKAKMILTVAFLSIILDCSNRKRDGNGLKVRATKVNNVPQYYLEKVKLIIQDIKDQQVPDSISSYGIYDTAYNLNSQYRGHWIKGAGAVIFSPPYANSFDYFESYKLELVLGDFADGIKGINALRKTAVRSFINADKQINCDYYVNLFAEEVSQAIPEKEQETGKRDTRTRKVPNMLRGYFTDMHEIIRQCALCLEKGRKTYIVVDQSAYVGKIIPTDLILSYLAEKEGFKVGRIIECRKARTSTQQLIKYPYLKTNLRESIVELIKI